MKNFIRKTNKQNKWAKVHLAHKNSILDRAICGKLLPSRQGGSESWVPTFEPVTCRPCLAKQHIWEQGAEA